MKYNYFEILGKDRHITWFQWLFQKTTWLNIWNICRGRLRIRRNHLPVSYRCSSAFVSSWSYGYGIVPPKSLYLDGIFVHQTHMLSGMNSSFIVLESRESQLSVNEHLKLELVKALDEIIAKDITLYLLAPNKCVRERAERLYKKFNNLDR